MNANDTTGAFEAYRPLLFSIAYRMLGSAMEAEDIVQEAYVRYQAVSSPAIQSPKAFLSTIVTRLCLNQLASARARREMYVGPWLPEPLPTGTGAGMTSGPRFDSPADQAELHESISLGFLLLLERLAPVERAVLLLREVFDYEYAEIAAILEKEEAACRQILSRAKKHVAEHRPRFQSTPEQHRQILDRFLQAVGQGELEELEKLLSAEVTMWADGGGRVRGAATQPLHGRAAVAQFVLASTRYLTGDVHVEVAEVNGREAAVLRRAGQAILVIAIEVDGGYVQELRVIGNPDKLRRV